MLEVQNLSVTARNGTQLLKQISFQIEIGEAVGLTGQSGAERARPRCSKPCLAF